MKLIAKFAYYFLMIRSQKFSPMKKDVLPIFHLPKIIDNKPNITFAVEYTCCPCLYYEEEEKNFKPREEYHLDNFFLYTNEYNF